MKRFGQVPLFFVLVSALSLLLGVGCGYRSTLGPGEGASAAPTAQGPAKQRTKLAVIALRNDSPEPRLDRILSDAMRREMSTRSGFDLVDDPRDADLVLRGRIRPLEVRSKSFSTFVAALEYSVTLEIDLEVVRATGDTIRLDRAMLSDTELYLASADIEVTRSNRLEALRRLSDLLASRVADSLELMERPIAEGEG
ncbi:MAG: hypothetical protein CL908_15000 [Deltaproteobacteria bacterium]|nr:hypothetical protein [Deltaproteobacteria bacterium]